MNATVTMWLNLVTTGGVEKSMPWDKLFELFESRVAFAGDREHPGWSAARFEPCARAAENVKAVTALVLDYDGTQPLEGAAEEWSEFYGLIHTTRKHTPEVHRFRVILPFGREVTPEEYAGIWRRIFARTGGKLDPAPKDPSRFWFTPGTPQTEHYRTIRLTGQPLDPDAALAQPDPELARPRERIVSTDNTERRASAYLARMPEAISGQQGHQALWAAALAVVQGFGLGEHAAFGLLWSEYNPRCQPPWSEKEIRHKVRDAANRSKVPSGYKLDDRWRPEPSRAPRPVHRARESPVEDDPAEQWDRLGEVTAASPPEPPPEPAVVKFNVRSVAEILAGVFQRSTSQRPERGCPSGNEQIDQLIGGFRRGRVTVLGASTSWGKSSFAVMVSDVGMRAGKRVLLVSGEDSEDTYGQRLMARRANVGAIGLRDSDMTPPEIGRMANVVASAEHSRFFLNGIGKHAEYLAAAIESIVHEEGTDLVIVDYLQAFSCGKRCQDRRNEITHIARTFTDAIKNSGAAGLIFSQLKRLEGQRPTMHDLKESGDVENMAEHVLIGYKLESKGNGPVAEPLRYLLIEKNKDGPLLGSPLEMPFDPKTASFIEQRPRANGATWHDRYDA